MNLYIETTLNELVKIFKLLRFKVMKEDNYFSAKLKTSGGRFHAMLKELENKIYCDLHFDNKRHWLLFGVDYKNRPKKFFEDKLRKILKDKKIKFEIEEVNWFTRRNKSVLEGLSCSQAQDFYKLHGSALLIETQK